VIEVVTALNLEGLRPLRNRPQAHRPAYSNPKTDLRIPVRRRSKLEEYAPVVFGGLLLASAFAFAGHYLGRDAGAHALAPAAVTVAEIAMPNLEAATKGSLLPEGETFDILNTQVIDSQIIDSASKTDFVIDDPIGSDFDSLEAPVQQKAIPLKAVKAKPEKKLVAKVEKKLRIEPAAIDLKEEAKKEKPIKKVVLVAPAKIEKAEQAPKLNKAEKQRAVAQRRIRLAEENCLARAIYFEARGETEMGQLAVAKVIINRTKNPRFPKTICGVVYQGSQRRNSCQFSFACDGHADEVRQPASWVQAKRVANRAIDGDHSLRNMNAVNYHADYVKPKWSKTMRRLTKIGRHIFYAGG
jgi:spore germination cell wall hydrolase CwlJ-like protein